MAMVGMDVEQVQGLGNQLRSQAHAIQGVINAVNGIVTNLEGAWKGSDATQFASWWNSQHRPALTAAMEAIDGLGQAALNNAAQQADVSSH